MNVNLKDHLKDIIPEDIDWETIINILHQHHYVIRPNNIKVEEIKKQRDRYKSLYKSAFLATKDLYEALLRIREQFNPGLVDERYLDRAEQVLNITDDIRRQNIRNIKSMYDKLVEPIK